MNKKLKATLILTLAAVMTSQTLVFGSFNKVKALDLSSQVIYAATEKNALGGFELVSKKWIKDLKCNAYIYKHTKSGARLIFLDNNNEDKMFSVTFRTPTKDNTGVNHIIEHSVLQGSKNYPVKDPFIEMSKQSLNTFLNAMTASDSTMYPVSSKNNKDFENLMSIYLDAVFYPNMVKDKRIFQEEGWRYELNSQDGELKYNGIVYNEMKGNYSSPERILNKAIAQSLFPDTSYKYESGGYPDDIPNLTYEDFVKTYKKHYTPSNSYFYLSGNLDINKTLKFIGEKYLNNFDKKEVNTKIQLQKPFNERKTKVVEYSVPKGTPIENKTYLSSNYVIDTVTNKDTVLGFLVLQTLLTGMPSSPISKALKENGFGENVRAQFDIQYLQPTFNITAENVNENQKEKFQKVIDETLQNIVKNGFDKDLLNSVLNIYELSNRTVKGNFALMYNNLIMRSWLYDGNPTLYLNINSDVANIKDKIQKGYLKTLIQKYLIDNKHSSLVVLKPVPGLEKKKEAELKAKLAKIKASLSKEDINKLVKETKELKAWQETPNSKEALNTLPSLTREDINIKAKEYKTIEKNENGVKVLYHPIFTNGVDSIRLYFDTTKVPQEKLGYMYLLEEILENIDTKNYTKEDLTEEILTNSGGISFSNTSFTKHGDNNTYYPKMTVSIVSLSEKLPKNFQLLQEIMYNSKLNDKTRLKEIINNMKMGKEMQLMSSGNAMAIQKVLSYMSESGKYNDYKNEDFYKFLCDLDKNFDNKSDEIVKKLQEVRNLIFNKQDMIASYTGEDENYKKFGDSFKDFTNNLRNEKLTSCKYTFDSSEINEGIMTPSKVQYVVKGGDLKKAGYESNGKLAVLSNILQSGYLWNNIRIKGGAYGANMTIDNSVVLFSSYRDPNLKETIDTIDGIPEYLKNFDADEKEMTNYVIGTIGKLDSATNMLSSIMGPAADGIIADSLYISHTKQSDIQKQREEIISTKAEDIRNFAPVIDALLKQDYLCVVGGETKIKENKKNFVAIKNLLNSKEEKTFFTDLEKKENVPVDKKWDVKFSQELDELTVNTSNVYVLDEQNHQVKVKVSYDKKDKAIKIESEKLYEKGKKYTLFIKGIQSVDKSKKVDKLLSPIEMEFVIQK
ncbi:insulinase family protein [Clostridium ganghwense]|uniref:Insulinase family protein n=1 Tax=Clostridium ganghwense TaxID=312089 RepID=A0ABT4CJV7_9CLOT|nr:insulinase family protein [Clostridium ganghwense]MCY6369335.1 insulinase family protein [Clostridium ganghwense]